MRFNIIINQDKCLRFGINVNQAALMQLFSELPSWATAKVFRGETYWHISRRKVIDEIPLFYEKPDTVYRAFKALADKNMIDYVSESRCDYVRLTALGTCWNKSEINPSFLGNRSELGNRSGKLGNESELLGNKSEFKSTENQVFKKPNSDSNPTYNNIIIPTIRESTALAFLEQNFASQLETFWMQHKTQIGADLEKFKLDFEDKITIELANARITWDGPALLARMRSFARNWIGNNAGKAERQNNGWQNNQQQTEPARRNKLV